MVSEDFEVGDLVWAKMKGYPPWPGKIEEPPTNAKSPKNKKAHFVYFFGSKNFAWILDENISLHSESSLNNLSKKKSAAYRSAIDDLIRFSKSNLKEQHSPRKDKSTSDAKKSPQSKVFKVVKDTSRKVERKVIASKTNKKRSFDSVNGEFSGCTSPKSQKLEYPDEDLVGSIPPNIANSDNTSVSEWDIDDESIMSSVNSLLSSIDQRNSSSLVQIKKVKPTIKKIGFIGLGYLGKAVVQALLKAGHDVTVWNKTSYKSYALVEYGAKVVKSPADLIVACDITFSCVSDPDASKSLVFRERGILKGLEQAEKMGKSERGYVEMTSIDPETSQQIAEAVGRKRCLYLEAPVHGSSNDAVNGQLIILASGDRTLFTECETCFQVIGKNAYYMSCEVGVGAKFSLLLNSFSGTMYAAAAECISLAKKMGLNQNVFLDILFEGLLNEKTANDKFERMVGCNVKPVTPLKHVQKDLNLIMLIADEFSQPMPVTAAANELYKHARLLQYSDYDVSAIYHTVRR